MRLSFSFCSAIKTSSCPLFVLATKSGFHPSRLSRLKNGEVVKRPHDIRFRILADIVGHRGTLFDEEQNIDAKT